MLFELTPVSFTSKTVFRDQNSHTRILQSANSDGDFARRPLQVENVAFGSVQVKIEASSYCSIVS
jgi:hypothetical protein